MSWRPAALTGTNDVPLVTRRRFGPAVVEEALPPQLAQAAPPAFRRPPPSETVGVKRGREDERSPVPDVAGKLFATHSNIVSYAVLVADGCLVIRHTHSSTHI
jgi:hypothetical protein